MFSTKARCKYGLGSPDALTEEDGYGEEAGEQGEHAILLLVVEEAVHLPHMVGHPAVGSLLSRTQWVHQHANSKPRHRKHSALLRNTGSYMRSLPRARPEGLTGDFNRGTGVTARQPSSANSDSCITCVTELSRRRQHSPQQPGRLQICMHARAAGPRHAGVLAWCRAVTVSRRCIQTDRLQGAGHMALPRLAVLKEV